MPNWMKRLGRRWRALFNGGALDAELDEEIRLHVELETEELMRALGLSYEEARRQAKVAFGGVERYREAQHDVRGVRWLEQLAQDVKYAVRSLRKTPGFTVTAVVTIALGIGVTTAVYSVIDRLLVDPLPFAHGDRTVVLGEEVPGTTRNGAYPSGWLLSNAVIDWAEHAETFAAVSPVHGGGATLRLGEQSLIVSESYVLTSLFSAMGVRPVIGRLFVDADSSAGAPRVMLLGEAFWRREFGADPKIIGRQLALDDTSYRVIGVVSDRLNALRGYQSVDAWLPITPPMFTHLGRTMQAVQAAGVVKPGVSRQRAAQELTVLRHRLMPPRTAEAVAHQPVARLIDPSTLLSTGLVTGLWILFGATVLVMLIASANVANLQLVRASRRAEETAVRAALGASRGRLVRQLLVESSLLAVGGGAGGILLAWWGLRAIVATRPAALPELAAMRLDPRVLAYGLALIALTSLGYGVLPALHATGSRVADTLRSGGRIGRSRARRHAQAIVVVGEIALSLVLLVGAGLLTHSFARMMAINPGFQPAGLVEIGTFLPRDRYADSTSRANFWSTAVTRARALPGVEAAVPATGGMLQEYYGFGTGKLQVEEGPHAPAPVEITYSQRPVPGQYFRVMGIRLRAGRGFSPEDERGQTQNVIIDQSLAEKLWPGQSAIGKHYRPYYPAHPQSWKRVEGVVSDVGLVGLPGVVSMQAYTPTRSNQLADAMGIMVRVRPGTDESRTIAALRGILHSIDPKLSPPTAISESSLLYTTVAIPRFSTTLLGVFAALALLLAAIGLYGVVAHAVSQRTHEIGVRIAMGARAADVVRLVIGDGARLAVVGVAIGLVAALAGARLVAGLLYEVSPIDPLVFVAIPLSLVVVALLASYLPARRAARVDPVIALRAE